jgi:predicted permease
VTAMGVFGNSNSLPISLVISLSQTLKGLHWDKIPGDNDDEVAARGILYLLIFQQLGQLVRWSWGYHVLLAPPDRTEEIQAASVEEGRYRDDPELLADEDAEEEEAAFLRRNRSSTDSFESGGVTPVTNAQYATSYAGDDEDRAEQGKGKASITPPNGLHFPNGHLNGDIVSFPSVGSIPLDDEPQGIKGAFSRAHANAKRRVLSSTYRLGRAIQHVYNTLPSPIRTFLTTIYNGLRRFLLGIWEFMNPPLWAMLLAVIVASIPELQRLFFQEGTFISTSVTRAVTQSGGVAVPLILVVLGANLARNTLPKEFHEQNSEEHKIGTQLLVASLVSRMLLPTLIMAPLLALAAKYVPVSIVDDPIFVIVCFLLTGAPSALQLAQICQINGVYENVMSKLLFQSYVIWILPSTLVLVMCALEVVEWAKA